MVLVLRGDLLIYLLLGVVPIASNSTPPPNNLGRKQQYAKVGTNEATTLLIAMYNIT
jgi:hypothetical protein